MSAASPSAPALAPAAASDCAGVATSRYRMPASRGSSGFRVSLAGSSSAAVTAGGGEIPNRRSTRRAAASVVGSAAVGPEPMVAGSSPATSDMASVASCAGAAAAASRPPLIAERCLRTVLISWMSAPAASRARFTACLSASVRPGAGRLSRAEAPPDSRNSTRSSGPAACARSRICFVAATPARSGTGWAASTTRIERQGTAWP